LIENCAANADGRRPSMTDHSEARLADLKERIEKGEYQVDPSAVADAILRRLRERLGQAPAAEAQSKNECSYPESPLSPSEKVTPGGPSTTDPTQVRLTPLSRSLRTVASTLLQALAGAQTQSS